MDADNLLTLLLPAVFPFIALAASIKLWIDARRGRRFSVVSSGLFFSAQAVTWALLGLLVANYQEISTDGTAFWAYLAIPAFWVGIPTVIVAFLATALAVATQRR